MVRFIIVRHGYSVGNKEKRFSGQADFSLDETGILQAKSTSEYILNSYNVDAVYSSDLSRAYQTVKPIADKLGLPVQKSKKLREVDVGIWEGMFVENVKKQYPEEFEMYITNPGMFTFCGGESYLEVMLRGKSAFEEIAINNDEKTIVMGVHGGNIRTLRAAWDNIPLEKIKDIPHVANASVTVAEYDRGTVNWIQIGYTDHLTDKTTEDGIK